MSGSRGRRLIVASTNIDSGCDCIQCHHCHAHHLQQQILQAEHVDIEGDDDARLSMDECIAASCRAGLGQR